MLRRDHQLRTRIHQLVDTSLFPLALWLTHLWRADWDLRVVGGAPSIGSFDQFIWMFCAVIPLSLVTLSSQGFYTRPICSSRHQTAWILLKACAMIVVTLILAAWLFRLNHLPRSIIILFGFVSFGLVYLKEELVQWGYRSRIGQLQLNKRVVLVGSKEDTVRLRQEFTDRSHEGLYIVAELDLNTTSVDQLVHLLHEHSINGVIFNAKHTHFGKVEEAIQACELEGVEAWLVADFFKTKISRTSFDEFYGRPVLVFQSAPETSWSGVLKQLVDHIGALILLTWLSLPMLAVAVIIKLSSPGPVLFRQQRSGLNGRPFTMYKFRSMVTNAEQRKHELAALNEMSGPVFKVTNDPRITRIGRFLRKYSIDELPQLLNVIKGEMSLVGPRPLPVDEVKRFDDFAHRRRLSVKPGLTCLWQISGRNQVTSFDDWVRLDLEYIDNWSLWLDLKILFRTIPVVLFAKGAK